MERSLRNRLTYGPLMMAAVLALLYLDHAIERWTASLNFPGKQNGYGIGGVGMLLILAIIIPPAVLEVANLFTAKQARPYRTIAALGSIALIVHAFLTQFLWFQDRSTSILALIIVFIMLGAALRRAWARQVNEAIVRMAGTLLASLYLGGLGWFLIALRVKHAKSSHDFHGSTIIIVAILLMVKATDIGGFF